MNASWSTGTSVFLQYPGKPRLRAVLTNAQPSIRGAALGGARHDAVAKGAASHPSVSRPMDRSQGVRRGRPWIIAECCGKLARFLFFKFRIVLNVYMGHGAMSLPFRSLLGMLGHS